MIPDTYLKLARQTDLVEAWRIFLEALSGYGIENAIYGYTDIKTSASIGSAVDALILTNFPDDYMRFFLNEDNFQSGPMIQWAAENTGSCSWSRIPDILDAYGNSVESIRTIEFTRSLGITSGYTVSFPQVGRRSKGAGALCPSSDVTQKDYDAMWAVKGAEIELLFTTFHLLVLALPHNFGRRVQLTARQTEILDLKADGKSTADIVQLLGIESTTVDKHLAAARTALSVETTAQAIRVMSSRNQIFMMGKGPTWDRR